MSLLEINIKAKSAPLRAPTPPKLGAINGLHHIWLTGTGTLEASCENGAWFTFPPVTAFNEFTLPQVENIWFKCKDGSRKMRLAK